MSGNIICHCCGSSIPLIQPVYAYDDKDGVEQTYDMLCWSEQVHEGIQGYLPKKVYEPLLRQQNNDDDAFGF